MGREKQKEYPQKLKIGLLRDMDVDNIPKKAEEIKEMWITIFF